MKGVVVPIRHLPVHLHAHALIMLTRIPNQPWQNQPASSIGHSLHHTILWGTHSRSGICERQLVSEGLTRLLHQDGPNHTGVNRLTFHFAYAASLSLTAHQPAISRCHGPLARYVKVRVADAPGMSGTFSPPPRVSDPDMHAGAAN